MKKYLLFTVLVCVLFSNCNRKNLIEKYHPNISAIKQLHNGFYNQWKDSVRVRHPQYTIWFDIGSDGNLKSVNKIIGDNSYLVPLDSNLLNNGIDTIDEKDQTQKYLDLSKQYHFRNMEVNDITYISLSAQDELVNRYFYPLSQMMRAEFMDNKEYQPIEDGWFLKQ